ncbi:geranylgeranyl diphosphate synthase type I [Nocardia tenerifensis]|uniref:Geranylgeranyl diphosphate synthase type I n=1 Tax=Nocardia tenerifensis TaxID=228006 RepID=A0A318K1B9_9NOCA|nr:polyprenyl synthetase family protein [Nocardia tenerifensis]PXX61771.1 geranylgeranyl diphosphate synthase type I [Nocardia tenerifensis]
MINAHAPAVADDRADKILSRARTLCQPQLKIAVGALSEPLQRIAGYHIGWCDEDGTARSHRSGKALRAALTLCVCQACGGSPTVALPAAAAVELIHNFTLVHDDLMDTDETRRGRPTVWRVWGADDAILLGDALHALAISVLATGLPGGLVPEAVSRLAAASAELCRGQHEDLALETDASAGVEEYLQMVMGKTGALMGCACALGGLCAGADEPTVAALDAYGRELGVAFQFVDDIIGIWGDTAATGKPVGNDLARHKRSLPVIIALRSGGSAAAELAEIYRSPEPMTTARIDRARTLVEAAGGLAAARAHAARQARKALAALPSHVVSTDLEILTDAVTHRVR